MTCQVTNQSPLTFLWAFLTCTYRFYVMSSTPEPRVKKRHDCGELPVAASWTPLAQHLLLLSHNDMNVMELQTDLSPASQAVVQRVATLYSQTNPAVALDSGPFQLGVYNLLRGHAALVQCRQL